jgi:hypothetical protein
MKKIIIIISLFAFFGKANAQSANANSKMNTQFSKPSKDYVMLQAGFNTWLLPNDTTIFLKERGHALGAYLCFDFPIKKSNFSFAAGAGIGNSSIYLDSMVLNLADTSVPARFVYDVKDYKRFKLSANYLEAPFELRYFQNKENRNKGFKAAIGLRAGLLVNLHSKGVLASGLKEKQNIRRYYDKWRYAATARIGWGNFSIFGTYQLNNVLNSQSLQGVTPVSMGICITGL